MVSINKYEDNLHNNNLLVIYMLVFSTILIPSIKVGSIPAFRVEQLIVILYLMYFFIKLTVGKKIKKNHSIFAGLYVGFSIFIVLSILVGSFKGIKIVINDFFELYKVLIYLGVYLITVSIVKSEKDKIKILNFINFCLLISVVIAVQQYFDLFNLNERYVHIIAPTQFRTLVNNYPTPRVIGMTSNPNVYAVMPGIGATISWSIYLTTREKRNILFLVVFILAVLMTLSRSGFVFMASSIATFTFLYFKSSFNFKTLVKGRINLKAIRILILSIFILTLLGLIIFNYLPEELTWRLMRGINIQTDSSFQARLRNWREHIDYFKSSPLFGLGPAKSIEYEHHVDNEWLLFLRQYGVVGCFYITFTFLSPLINKKDTFFRNLYLSILVGSALYMIPAVIYNSFQIMPLIMIMIGLI